MLLLIVVIVIVIVIVPALVLVVAAVALIWHPSCHHSPANLEHLARWLTSDLSLNFLHSPKEKVDTLASLTHKNSQAHPASEERRDACVAECPKGSSCHPVLVRFRESNVQTKRNLRTCPARWRTLLANILVEGPTDKTRYFVSSSSTTFLFKFSATSVGSKLYRPTAPYCYLFSSHLQLSSWVPLQIQPSGTCDPRWFGRSYPKGQQMSWWLPRSWIQNRDRNNSPNFGEMTHHKPSHAPNPWHFIGWIGPSRERPGFIFQRWTSWSNPYVRLVTCLSARRIRGLKEFQEIQSPKLNIILHLYFWGCEESSSLGHKIAEVFWDQKSVMLFFQVQNAGPFWEQLLKVIFEKHPFYPPKFGNENNIRTSFHRFSPTFPHYSFLVYYICWYDPTPPPTRGR